MTQRFSAEVLAHLSRTAVPERLRNTDAVVLERIAWGAGQTNWYYCRELSVLDAIASQLSPGSDVRFYFDDRFQRPTADKLAVVARAIMVATGEVLIGVLSADGFRIEMTMLGNEDELLEIANGLPPDAALFVGVFPAADNDGVCAVTTVLPDQDGVIRAHPY